ncbi:hypothetical protein A2483_05115 [Candidatus Peregrinibacteria bacterium RIFOXYC2_FULL_33_13]|nr:MAG: hypothetical protein UR27_C0015G0043 [Candidatus Peregrinibacteria bacterium GW2011_GWA2_33_10]KKP39545.1 MAG: hypothetical protein UR30_C0010G0041 [Candidatus Peregrinibacteria bacterium GW2011_GWC2_33_13]OGJ55269.1 MAG: hypothetical protein A2483_05115 [Candidatus Peregrinibacteria bacterium RIFOXYC2_FULL_33_13]
MKISQLFNAFTGGSYFFDVVFLGAILAFISALIIRFINNSTRFTISYKTHLSVIFATFILILLGSIVRVSAFI